MISIIIPVYNTAPYLDACIESVVNQSYADWECILVDDGSTDNSGAICDEWCRKDKRIHVIHQENKGVSAARNHGLRIAKGDFIAFIDSDDWVEKDYLRSLHNAIIKDDADLAVCGMILDYANGAHEIYAPSVEEIFELSSENTNKFVDLNEKYLLYGPYIKLYKRQIISNNNVLFDSNYSYGEDLLFNYEYLNHISKISVVSNSKYHYRIFSNNTLSNKFREDKFDIDYKQWQLLKSFYLAKGMWNDISKALLYKRLWGIVYSGIFSAYRKPLDKQFKVVSYVLSIPEIEELKHWRNIFDCSNWIKWSVLHRIKFIFILVLSLNKKK